MEDRVKELISGWQDETDEERERDINKFLYSTLNKYNTQIKEEAKEKIIKLDDKIKF